MIKKAVAILFTVLFMALITAPSVIIALDDSFDTSIFYSITEEEEHSKYKNLVSPFTLQNPDYLAQISLNSERFFSYRFKKYPKPHLNLISPPPEPSIV